MIQFVSTNHPNIFWRKLLKDRKFAGKHTIPEYTPGGMKMRKQIKWFTVTKSLTNFKADIFHLLSTPFQIHFQDHCIYAYGIAWLAFVMLCYVFSRIFIKVITCMICFCCAWTKVDSKPNRTIVPSSIILRKNNWFDSRL